MEVLHREIERLKVERRQLEFHVERTGTQNSTTYMFSDRNITIKALPWTTETTETKLITSQQQSFIYCCCCKLLWQIVFHSDADIST